MRQLARKVAGATASLCGALGCQSPALVGTARTLPAGGHDLAFSLNVTRVSLDELDVEGTNIPLQGFNLPNPLPDVLYDYGITDDIELGGRLPLIVTPARSRTPRCGAAESHRCPD